MAEGKAGALVAAVVLLPVLVAVSVPVMVLATDQSETAGLCEMPSAAAAGGFTSEQVTIARSAAQVAAIRHLPVQADLIILATGFQESGIRNLSYGDRDSVGWLQQRAGWGTVSQRMNPAYAAGKFFDALVKVPDWQTLPVTVAAQRVQISAFPDAYAQWVPKAQALFGQLGDVTADACSASSSTSTAAGGGAIPTSFDHQGNPRTAEQAAQWISGQVAHRTTSENVVGACERWQNLAYGLSGGYPTAIAHWNAPGPRHPAGEAAPRGALIFMWTRNPDRHVIFSLGNGMAVSTDFDGHSYHAGALGIGRVRDIEKAFGGYELGWRQPNFKIGSEAS